MSKRIITTVAGLDALPEGSVVRGHNDGFPMVAAKPRAADYPRAEHGFWETLGSEIGTLAEYLIADCGTLTVLYETDDDD